MDLYITIHVLVFLSLIFELAPLSVKKKIMILWCVFFTLFGGLRWRTGGDWYQYYGHFLFSDWSNIFNYDRYGNGAETLEPGFVFFNVLIKSLFGEFYIYNLIVVGFIQFTYYKFCNYFFPMRPLMTYCYLMLMASYYFPVRAGLSIGICMWAWRYIKERKLYPFLLVVAIATLIHNQAIVLLPAYWFGNLRLKNFWYLSFYMAFVAFYMVFQQYFTLLMLASGGDIAEKAYAYTQNETDGFQGACYMGWGLNFLFLITYLYIRKKCKLLIDNWYHCLLNAFMIYMLIIIIFQEGMGDLARLASTFFPAQCILFMYSMNYFFQRKKKIFRFAALSFFLAYYVYKMPSIWSGYFFEDTCVPYKTIFDYNRI